MRLLSLNVQNVRGLPNLRLQLDGKSIVIWGPNGVGKSSVVDAIEFLFTGRISRLAGEGTGGITLNQHGPHIDHTPESALVSATVQAEGFLEPISMARTMGQPDELECPSETAALLDEMCGTMRRGGAILTRRDILRYVTAKAGTRSDQIQELLNLKEIEATRSSLIRTQTELKRDEQKASEAMATAESNVNVILGHSKFTPERLSEVVNQCRSALGGDPTSEVRSSSLKAAINSPIQKPDHSPAIDLAHLQRILENITQATREDLRPERKRAEENLRKHLADLKANADLLNELGRLELTKHALRFVDHSTTECPVCGASWSEGHLRVHLTDKIETAGAAAAAKELVTKAAEALAAPARGLRANVGALRDLLSQSGQDDEHQQDLVVLGRWLNSLDTLLTTLGEPVNLNLDSGFPTSAIAESFVPDESDALLNRIEKAIRQNVPEPTVEQAAWDTLTRLEVTLSALESRTKERLEASLNRSRADALVTEYEAGRDSVLHDLYTRIGDRFTEYYCVLHDHEKEYFDARLQPQHAGLGFEVEFLGRGGHPPHALHSEGHQDSMGVCLFLALNDELAMPKFDLVIFDDVIMSIDSGHRKDVCRLLKEKFSDRQFIITTHDKTWTQQLKQEQVVERERVIEFTGWTVKGGPRTDQQTDMWEAIYADLERDHIQDAAFKLRRGSEAFFERTCDALGAKLVYNSSLQWQLGDWLPAAMEQYKQLLRKARGAASSWEHQETIATLNEQESVRKQIFGRTHVEQWAINAAVHYNAWENMSRPDFAPVIDAFRDLYSLFECSGCRFLLELIPRTHAAEVVKCRCGKVNWNLLNKPNPS